MWRTMAMMAVVGGLLVGGAAPALAGPLDPVEGGFDKVLDGGEGLLDKAADGGEGALDKTLDAVDF